MLGDRFTMRNMQASEPRDFVVSDGLAEFKHKVKCSKSPKVVDILEALYYARRGEELAGAYGLPDAMFRLQGDILSQMLSDILEGRSDGS